MGSQRRSQGVRAKYAFIKAHRHESDTATMCRVLQASRGGYYEWLRHPLFAEMSRGKAFADHRSTA